MAACVVGAKREAQKDSNNTNSRFISECSDTMEMLPCRGSADNSLVCAVGWPSADRRQQLGGATLERSQGEGVQLYSLE